jgi:hypothetical protein
MMGEFPSILFFFFIGENQCAAFGKGLRSLPPGNGDYTLNGSPGDPHPLAGLFLGQTFPIAEPEDFQFVPKEVDVSEFVQGRAGYFKCPSAEFAFAAPDFFWSW